MSTAFEAKSAAALEESVRAVEAAERRVAAALSLAQEAEEKVCAGPQPCSTGPIVIWHESAALQRKVPCVPLTHLATDDWLANDAATSPCGAVLAP